MKKNVYAVYDVKAKAYSNPFYSPREELAVRDFKQAVNDGMSTISKFPEDFHLVELGKFDDETGAFETATPSIIVYANFLKE